MAERFVLLFDDEQQPSVVPAPEGAPVPGRSPFPDTFESRAKAWATAVEIIEAMSTRLKKARRKAKSRLHALGRVKVEGIVLTSSQIQWLRWLKEVRQPSGAAPVAPTGTVNHATRQRLKARGLVFLDAYLQYHLTQLGEQVLSRLTPDA